MAETAVRIEIKPSAAGRLIRRPIVLVIVMTQMRHLRRFILVLAIPRRCRECCVQGKKHENYQDHQAVHSAGKSIIRHWCP